MRIFQIIITFIFLFIGTVYADSLKEQDGLLNVGYKELRSCLSKPAFTKLKKAQRGWISFRDKACDFTEINDDCLTQLTKHRVIELTSLENALCDGKDYTQAIEKDPEHDQNKEPLIDKESEEPKESLSPTSTSEPDSLPSGMKSCRDESLKEEVTKLSKKSMLGKMGIYILKIKSISFDKFDSDKSQFFCLADVLMNSGDDAEYEVRQQIVDDKVYLFIKPLFDY